MPSISVKIEGLREVLRATDPERYRQAVGRGVVLVAQELKTRMAVYPPVRRGPMVGGFKSAKQRKAVHAIARAGLIPYRRGINPNSQTLGRRWAVSFSGTSATASNAASYARLVQSEEDQAAYHRITGWITDVKAVAEVQPIAGEIVADEVERSFRT